MIAYYFRRIVGLLVLLCGLMQAVAGMAQAHTKRTYYDYQGRQLHEEYQYVSTATNRFSKQGFFKEYNEDGTLLRKGSYRNNKAEGRQLTYFTSDGNTWLEYDMMVHNNLRNGPYIQYDGPGKKISSGNYVNASREGQWKFYYPEGHEVCTYRDDKKEGPATLFYKNGKVADQYAYRNDEHYDDGRQQAAAKRQQDFVKTEQRILSAATDLLVNAVYKQEGMARDAASGVGKDLQEKLYVGLFQQLMAECKAAKAGNDMLAKAKRLTQLLDLTQTLAAGQQPDLDKAIRHENDLNKVLALTGL